MAISDILVDKRIIDRNLQKGLLTEKDHAKYLEGLKNVEDQMESVSIDDDEDVAAAKGSYYKEIDGKKYDAALIAAAEEAIAGSGDGRISQEDAEKLLVQVKDGAKYTDIEKATVAYIRDQMKWTDAANDWFRTEIRKWAAEKGHDAQDGAAAAGQGEDVGQGAAAAGQGEDVGQ